MNQAVLITGLIAVICVGALAGCGDSGVANTPTGSIGFTAQQRLVADQMVSVFENDTPAIQYGYAENINDGRGITAGRAGFTSATGDLLVVVERYTAVVPGNGLAGYLPRLRELAAAASDSTTGLDGLVAAWLASASDPTFRRIQDSIVDEEYFNPALAHAVDLGLTHPLSLMTLYDTAIQHGDGNDPDGLPAIITRTTAQVGGTPKQGRDEQTWLRAFIGIRRSVLLNATNPDTRKAWAESTPRADVLLALLDAGNLSLTPPITIAPYGTSFTLPI